MRNNLSSNIEKKKKADHTYVVYFTKEFHPQLNSPTNDDLLQKYNNNNNQAF
jgi:hypothetical protein